jgi:hypothetical protein
MWHYILEDRENFVIPIMEWIRVWLWPTADPDVKNRNAKLSYGNVACTSHFTTSKCTVMFTSKNCRRAVARHTIVISRTLYRGTPTTRTPWRPGIRIITAATNNLFHFILEQYNLCNKTEHWLKQQCLWLAFRVIWLNFQPWHIMNIWIDNFHGFHSFWKADGQR